MLRWLLRVALLLALSLTAAAQTPLDQPTFGQKPAPQWVTQVGSPSVTVAAGKPHQVELRFHITEGDHINSSTPGSEQLIPTHLTLMPPTDVGTGKIEYPAGEDLTFPFDPDEKLNVYTGDIVIKAMVSAQRTAVPGNYRVHGELRYQACNDRACFPPKTLPVAFDVKVTRTSLRNPNAPMSQNPPKS